MFQNIAEEEKTEKEVQEEILQEKYGFKDILKKLFTKQNILVYIISFMLSMVSTSMRYCAFCSCNFCCISFKWIASGSYFGAYGSAVRQSGVGGAQALTYVITALVFVALVLIFKPWYEEEYKSERRKLGKYVLISTFLVQIVQMLIKGFLLYDLFLSLTTAVITYIFYKIFANSLTVFSEFGVTKAFTVEEVVGASLMLAIAVTAFGDFQIFGFDVKTVLCILIVLVLGWKQGILLRWGEWYHDWCCNWYNLRKQ